MGVVDNITHERFPKQAEHSLFKPGARVSVCYHYKTEHRHEGTIVRNDDEAPYLTIFQLDNGRYVLATECQYALLPTPEKPPQ